VYVWIGFGAVVARPWLSKAGNIRVGEFLLRNLDDEVGVTVASTKTEKLFGLLSQSEHARLGGANIYQR
jgi:hypothetical protein